MTTGKSSNSKIFDQAGIEVRSTELPERASRRAQLCCFIARLANLVWLAYADFALEYLDLVTHQGSVPTPPGAASGKPSASSSTKEKTGVGSLK